MFKDCGLTLAIGWPAQWSASFTGLAAGVHIKAGQEKSPRNIMMLTNGSRGGCGNAGAAILPVVPDPALRETGGWPVQLFCGTNQMVDRGAGRRVAAPVGVTEVNVTFPYPRPIRTMPLP